MEEDFAVYNFEDIEDNNNNQNNLLYAEEDQNWDDDETFGSLEIEDNNGNKSTIGRDFDFAGSTSKFLGSQPINPNTIINENSWTNTSHVSKFPSPWSNLDADPLLSSRRDSFPISNNNTTSTSRLNSISTTPISNTPIAPKRVMRTLEEIEAEQRAQPRPNSVVSIPRQGRTLEEVEAEMLRGARSQQQQQQPQQMQQQQMQQQQFYQQQQFPPPQNSNSPFPPQFSSPYPPQNYPQQQQQQFPPQFQQQQGRPGSIPPGMLPPHLQNQNQNQQQQRSGNQQVGRPSTPQQQQAQQAQQQHIQHQQQMFAQQQLQLRAHQQQAQQLQLQANNNGPPNMLSTLFPPLPSQVVQPVQPISIEQQLAYLSTNQHAQHPSLTGAQLQVLLQQAQLQAKKQEGDVVMEGEDKVEIGDEEKEEKLKQAKAGEELIRNVEERIREHEMIESKRKAKAAKIAGMAKHNNLMSNSDKDFITRIQVSQLVTDDPYADDFYFHIMAAIKQSRMNAIRNAEMQNNQNQQMGNGNMMNNGNNHNNNNHNNNNGRMNNRNERKPTRRENAMNKMAQNVQRLVDSAKQRNRSGELSIAGALGKIALRTRSAPRQLLQVTPSSTTPAPSSAGHALLAGLISSSSHLDTTKLGSASVQLDENGQQPPLKHRVILQIVEEIYDLVLDLEQLRRVHGNLLAAQAGEANYFEERTRTRIERGEEVAEVEGTLEGERPAARAVEEWDAKYAELAEKLWTCMRVMEPLDISVPHPFISLVSVLKGKRILPRALRHCSPEQTLTLLTLMVATFDTLDTVQDASLLDTTNDPTIEASTERKELRASIENKTEVFLHAIISPVMSVIGSAPLRLVTGMLGLLMDRNDILKVVRSKPGVAFLTVFLSRAESLKQATPAPEAQDLQQWQQVFGNLFHALSGDFPSLFPSTRAVTALPFGASYYLANQTNSTTSSRTDLDREDEPVWRFLAAVAVCADPQEQQDLVTAVRDKVLENVSSAKKLKVTPEVAALKIRNVDLLLNSLGLSATQLTVED